LREIRRVISGATHPGSLSRHALVEARSKEHGASSGELREERRSDEEGGRI
jgi:hypothetical protein